MLEGVHRFEEEPVIGNARDKPTYEETNTALQGSAAPAICPSLLIMGMARLGRITDIVKL